MNWFSFSKPHFSKAELERIKQAIASAELQTSGEIRVFIENKCKAESPLDRAVECFHQLKMENTKDKNGVLIYIALKDKKFAIIGDSGINKLVEPDFWEMAKEELKINLSNKKIVDGICQCVATVGIQLKKLFPYQSDDKNELSNDVVIG